jgi:hypothetical protein
MGKSAGSFQPTSRPPPLRSQTLTRARCPTALRCGSTARAGDANEPAGIGRRVFGAAARARRARGAGQSERGGSRGISGGREKDVLRGAFGPDRPKLPQLGQIPQFAVFGSWKTGGIPPKAATMADAALARGAGTAPDLRWSVVPGRRQNPPAPSLSYASGGPSRMGRKSLKKKIIRLVEARKWATSGIDAHLDDRRGVSI